MMVTVCSGDNLRPMGVLSWLGFASTGRAFQDEASVVTDQFWSQKTAQHLAFKVTPEGEVKRLDSRLEGKLGPGHLLDDARFGAIGHFF